MTTDNYIQIFGFISMVLITIWSTLYAGNKSKNAISSKPKAIKNNPTEDKTWKRSYRFLLGLTIIVLIFSTYGLSREINWHSIFIFTLNVVLVFYLFILNVLDRLLSIMDRHIDVTKKMWEVREKSNK